jgi:hypothetical protein
MRGNELSCLGYSFEMKKNTTEEVRFYSSQLFLDLPAYALSFRMRL